ncbi:MAG: histidine phosphatase family protein, partial [Pseudomonadota bacterium]
MFAITPLKTDTIYLLTHAQAHGDGLTETGQATAHALVDRLKPLEIDGLFTSPAGACRETVAPFHVASGIPVMALPDLRDHRLSLQGNAPDDPMLEERFTQRAKARPGGETFNAAAGRLRQAVLAISRRPIIAPLMVTHRGLLAALLSQRDKTFGFAEYETMPEGGLWKLTHRNGSPT